MRKNNFEAEGATRSQVFRIIGSTEVGEAVMITGADELGFASNDQSNPRPMAPLDIVYGARTARNFTRKRRRKDTTSMTSYTGSETILGTCRRRGYAPFISIGQYLTQNNIGRHHGPPVGIYCLPARLAIHSRSLLALLAVLMPILFAYCAVQTAAAEPHAVAEMARVPNGGAGPVNANGNVGRLRIDHSTAAEVKAFAGHPEYARAGAFRPLIQDFGTFMALGYGCKRVRSSGIPTLKYNRKTGVPRDSHVDCITIYFINRRTQTLAGFKTYSAHFRTAAGVRPGAKMSEAKRREKHYYISEVPPGLNERTTTAWLSLDQTTIVTKSGWRPGSRIASLTLESRRHPMGLQFV